MKHSCGADSTVSRGPDGRSLADAAMHTCRRVRSCAACGVTFRTTEIDSSELADLRRRAYLFGLPKKRRAG